MLRTGGTIEIPPPIPVKPDPSPTKRPNIVPAEIVEKKPNRYRKLINYRK